jgi:cell division protein FtsI/penicillin-binding protein 2
MKNPLAWRFLTVQILLAFIGLSIPAKVFYLQHSVQAQEILAAVEPWNGWEETLYPQRGEIYDYKGHLLAGNQTAYEVGVDLKVLKDLSEFDRIAQENNLALAAQYLGMTHAEAIFKIENPPFDYSVYVVLADNVPEDKAQYLKDLKKNTANESNGHNLNQLHFRQHYRRSYTEGSLASNVIGYVLPEDQVGLSGVEEKYNSLLAGESVTIWQSTEPDLLRDLPKSPIGTSLILTFTREIQAAVEGVLDKAVDDTGAESGTVIVMDPQTGEILAMATFPRPSLNDQAHYGENLSIEHPLNPAVSKDYEPGSVFKILTMAAALDAGVIKPEDTFFDIGITLYGGVDFHNWENTVWGLQDMTGCLQHSINTCFIYIADKLGKDSFYTYMQKFGIGHTTGIDLAGEAPGQMRLPSDTVIPWTEPDLASHSFGQGLSTTPIQMVMAASAIANGGKMVYPHVVYATVENGIQTETPRSVVATPIKTETAHTLSEMLANSLENEASEALVPGYRLAGKTGTAQIPPYYEHLDETNASFVGWGPVDDPKFLVYVWLEKPRTAIWASKVAAPVFREVVEKLIVLMGIPPDNIRLQTATP